MQVVESSSEAKGLEAGVGVEDDLAPDIIVHALHDSAISGVDNEPWAAQVVGYDTVGVATLDQVGGYIGLVAVDEAGLEVAAGVEFGDGVERAFVQQALDEGAVDLLADAPVPAVDEVVDGDVAWQLNLHQVTQQVVGIGGG